MRRATCLLAVLAFALPLTARAETPLRVIELFTSQGCSSCPPADELLGELIEREPDLIALEYHVDYWNKLVHGGDGNWVDPFSDPAWTARQRGYGMAALDGRRGVYTPQAVVNGRYATVGSDERRIVVALEDAGVPDVTVDIAADGDELVVTVATGGDAPPPMDVEVLLVRYLESADTEITAGENRHRTVRNHHIVRTLESLGALTEGTQRFGIAQAAEDDGCAVLVQDRFMAPILGAARCP